MARTPIFAFGRLELHYTAYTKPHVFRCWVVPFLFDVAVGTFSAPGTPASLDALATDLANVIKPTYVADSDLSFGSWVGGQTISPTNESFVPAVSGTISGVTAAFGTGANVPGAVSQGNWAFRDADGLRMKYTLIGEQYFGFEKKFYADLGGGYKDLADYILGSSRITGRGGAVVSSMLDLTFDTNDGLTRKYRR